MKETSVKSPKNPLNLHSFTTNIAKINWSFIKAPFSYICSWKHGKTYRFMFYINYIYIADLESC